MYNLTIAELVRGLQSKAFSSVELTQHFLDRIAALNPDYNAVITVTADQACKSRHRGRQTPGRRWRPRPLWGTYFA